MTSSTRRHILTAVVVLLLFALGFHRRVVWSEERSLPGIGGDALQYVQLAASLERTRTFSFDGVQPIWTRLPGYPLFLWATTRPSPAAALSAPGPQRSEQLRAFLRSCVHANLLVDCLLGGLIALMAWALGSNVYYSLIVLLMWMLQPWSMVFVRHPLADGLSAALTAGSFCLAQVAFRWRDRGVLAALLFLSSCIAAGLTSLVRPDGITLFPLLLLGIVLGPFRWAVRARLALLLLLGFVMTSGVWLVRNQLQFGAPHVFAGAAGIDEKGAVFDRLPVMEWQRTWPPTDHFTVRVAWPFPHRPVALSSLSSEYYGPPTAQQSLEQLLLDYNGRLSLDPDLNARFVEQAAQRRRWFTKEVYLLWPLQRIRLSLFAPHDGVGLGTLPTLLEHRVLWASVQNGLLIAGLLALALLLVLFRRAMPLVVPLVMFVLIRIAAAGWNPGPEPRYLLALWPILFAAAATVPQSVRYLVSSKDRHPALFAAS